jgi:hypothetical protein
MAKSTIVVVPPKAAARVPVSKVSLDRVPPKGISMWVCTSMPPGTTSLSDASTRTSAPSAKREASSEPGSARATIRSPSTRTSWRVTPVLLTTAPPVTTVRIGSSSSLR